MANTSREERPPMVCVNCGAANPENLQFCRNCGKGLAAQPSRVVRGSASGSAAAAAPARAGRTQVEAGVLSPPPDAQSPPSGTAPVAPLASPSALQPGILFGQRYRVEMLLGQGGMGAVYKAFDIELERTVALKLVRPELASRPETMQRFKQELLLSSKISHKNILRIHDLGDADGIKFISMAFVEGKDLADVMEAGRLPLDRALNFTRQLCAALEAAHSEGVVHRDLKPQNVLIDQADNLYISDFGLAKSLEPAATMMTRTGQVLGTPRYMSPEQAESKEVDHRADLYALGLIAFEMFTGQLPFRGESALQLMYQRVTEPAKDPRTILPDLPEYLAKVILKCLEREPARRYQEAREILQDLEARQAPSASASAGARTVPSRLLPTRAVRRVQSAVVLAGSLAVGAALLLVPAIRQRVLPAGLSTGRAAPAGIQSYLAVLPLRTAGDEQNARYIADGVADSLSAKLAALKKVYVAPASAVNTAMKLQNPAKIAHALGVKLLLEGTVITGANDTVTVSVSLDDVSNPARNLLHQDFTGPRRDLLNLEDRIFSRLVDTLDIKQSSEEQARSAMRPTQDLGAYEAYLRGRKVWRESHNTLDLQQAIGLFNQAIRQDPRFALAYAGLADADRRMWDKTKDGSWTRQAMGAAQQAQALNDNLPEVHFTLGSLYTDTGRTAEAIAELQRALQLAPNSDEALRRLGTAYMKAGREQEAIAAYTKATEVNPYLWTNFNSLGGAYFGVGENQQALMAFQHITALEPGRAEGWEGVGMVYYRLGRWSECLGAFQKAVAIQPTGQNDSNLATAYYFLGRFPEAAQMYEKAVAADPDDDNIRVNLADAYRWSGQSAKAAATYAQAVTLAYKSIQVNPKDSQALGNLALCYAKKGDARHALEFINRARAIDQQDNSLMYEEAVIHALAGRNKEALASLAQALRSGYSLQEARSDPELKALRQMPEFKQLASQIPQVR